MRFLFFTSIVLMIFAGNLQAQEPSHEQALEQSKLSQYYMYVIGEDGDTIPLFQLRPVHIYPKMSFRTEAQRQEYARLVRDVRKVYPYARLISQSIIETYEVVQTLPDEKTKQKHLDQVQKFMMEQYKPQLKKMTKTQGRILIKLIDRECNTSSYNIVKAIVGSFKAGVYNIFAGMFGNSLKTEYDPSGKDAAIEAIVRQIEDGTIDYYYTNNYHSK